MEQIYKAFYNFIDLHPGEEDKKSVLENVTKDVSFRGSNLWILACAIVIASVGLNVNSTAVVIGAMLISPLMGPIVGTGVALGTFNFPLLHKALKNLMVATVVSLFVSAIYFFLSPFKEVQPELLARTAPNIYDVIIAFFGGLAGIIAVTRVEKGNPIPGVAIATALMPPLCAAGYGLATLNWSFLFGALYLYSINCAFICIATFLTVKYLRYPVRKLMQNKYEKTVRYVLTALIFVLLVPSVYFAWALLNEKHYEEQVNTFLKKEFTDQGGTIIYKKTNTASNPKTVEVALLGQRFTAEDQERYQSKLEAAGITRTELIIKQDPTDVKKLLEDVEQRNEALISERDLQIQALQKRIETQETEDTVIEREAKVLFPDIEALAIARYPQQDENQEIRVLYRATGTISLQEKEKLQEWLQIRLRTDQEIKLIQE